MIIECVQKERTAEQLVNLFGKYLYKQLDGGFKLKHSVQMCDVFVLLLYQVSAPHRTDKARNYDMHEMTLNINLTTYQDKIRVNIIELTPEERTLGHFVLTPDQLSNFEIARKLVHDKIVKYVSKAYSKYDFLF